MTHKPFVPSALLHPSVEPVEPSSCVACGASHGPHRLWTMTPRGPECVDCAHPHQPSAVPPQVTQEDCDRVYASLRAAGLGDRFWKNPAQESAA